MSRARAIAAKHSFPLILQNVHRYFLYLALVFLFVLVARRVEGDVVHRRRDGRTTFGIGVGTLVLAINSALLTGYTLGCHSFRHLVGGGLDQFSGASGADRRCTTPPARFNCHHKRWAWASLFGVALADLYVRLCSMGVLTDWRIL